MVQIYRRKWRRGVLASFFGYLRDSLVLCLPCRRLPKFLIKLLYGSEIQFAFLVHPRAYHDAFVSLPFFTWLKFILRRKDSYNFLSHTNPFVLNKVSTPQGLKGFVLAQLTVPEIMFEKRKETLEQLKRMVQLVGKISGPSTVIGLGGWFPMVCRRGIDLEKIAKEYDLIITNGHCGTLASIYMMVEKIAAIGKIPLSDVCVAVIGVGKMGTNVAKALNGKVKRIILIDINKSSLEKTKMLFEKSKTNTQIEIYLSGESTKTMRETLEGCEVGVCATSTFRNLLKLKDMPTGFIAIDDSRPEALPRDPRKERLILEGGLLKIKGAKVDYNYGFGEDDNVFGCLGEAFLVAFGNKNSEMKIRPTLGDVDMLNFFNLLELCKNCGVVEGDFKSSDESITTSDIETALATQKVNKKVY